MNRLSRNKFIPLPPTIPDSKPKVERPLLILPTYNEADNIIQILEAIETLPREISILVVDDSSPDGTSKLVTDYPSFEKNVFLIKRSKKVSVSLRGTIIPPAPSMINDSDSGNLIFSNLISVFSMAAASCGESAALKRYASG